ncbi:hypothetical protein [Nostoc sp. FACHB-190]|uniref:VMAP-C domain-containing protein n=1 Tax=Nostoc sp. FACHB-190 TaxID=2692838 RepID=UPI001687E485|nr:hypothetical protein [Nostoc sp. FACHB-190]MBD2303028.1 hypothetical protein [Nostoc sp. FACHB-190]
MSKFEIETSDIEILKSLLKSRQTITSNRIVRENFCQSIGIKIDDISPDSVAFLSDDSFIETLLNYLQRTDNKSALYKLCVNIENFDQLSKFAYQLSNIKRKLRLSAILTILQLNDFDNLFEKCNSAYQQCLFHKNINIDIPNKLELNLSKISEILEKLNNHYDDYNNNFSLLDCFIVYLKLHIDNEFPEVKRLIERWIDIYLPNLFDLLNLIKLKNAESQQRISNSQPCLLLVVFERNEGLRAKAWVINDIREYNINQINDCQPLNEQELPVELQTFPIIFRDIYLNSLEYCKNRNLNNIQKIKVFLPYKLIDCEINPIDKLTIKEEYPRFITPDTFGKEYEIILEFSERLGINHEVVKWEKKRNNFISCKLVQDIFITEKLDNVKLKQLYKKLDSDSVFGFRFINTIDIKIVMEILFYSGIPFALWVRKEIPEVNLQEELDNICQSGCLESLSSIIKEKRCEAWQEEDNDNHIGNHLSLMFDTANLRPLPKQLSMP